jgi:hypothetical protein
MSKDRSKSAQEIYEQVLNDMLSGEYNRRFKEEFWKHNEYAYVASTRGPSFVDKVFKDGTRVTCKVVDGKFVVVNK